MTQKHFTHYFALLIIVLAVKAALMVGLILYGEIGLGPDEAQYWTWSQFLDWGYYSKPPGIAWQIWLGTKLFGNTELGVRFFSLVFAFLISLSVYRLALACRLQPRTAFWAGVAMALSPLGVMASLFAITDVGMVLFWTWCCIVMAEALAQKHSPNFLLLGLLVGIGALFKWQAYYFWLLVVGFIPFYRFLYKKELFAGIVISLLGLFPSIVWNSKHNWVTFRHVLATFLGGHAENKESSHLFHGNFFDFLGAQAMLLSPVLFVLLILAGVHLLMKRKETSPPIVFCGISSLLIIAVNCVAAILQKMQGNWSDFAYPTAIVFLCWYACEQVRWGSIVLQCGIFLSLLICVFGFSIPYLQSHNVLSRFPILYKLNPFRHNVGWKNLSSELLELGYDPQEHFLFGDKYQTSSILSFYGPQQKRAYFLNLHGIRKNQFSFWPGMAEDQLHKTGFFVLTENHPHLENLIERSAFYRGALSQYFKKVTFLGIKPLFETYGDTTKSALYFKGEDYNGLQPIDVDLY